jgi:tetratricopeptide (TPR) repeat protein
LQSFENSGKSRTLYQNYKTKLRYPHQIHFSTRVMNFTNSLPTSSKPAKVSLSVKMPGTLKKTWTAIAFCSLSACFITAQAQTSAPASTTTAAPAAAPVVLRPEVVKSLQAAQDALKAGQLDSALALAQQTMALPGITATEKPIIQRTLAVAAMQTKNFPLAISTLENLIQELPDSTPMAQKLQLMESLLSASQQAQDLPRVVSWARTYLKLEGSNPSVRPVLIQTLSVLKRHDEVVQEVKEKMRLDEMAKLKTPENEMRIMAISQRQLKDDAGYTQTLKWLLQNYPTKAYFGEMIPRLARQASFNARFDLDLYRLLEATGNMEDTVEYYDMANLALKAGLPAEAARVVERAYSEGLFGKGSDAANHQKLKQQTQQRLTEDEKALPALEKSAKDANTIASLADVYASKQKWDLALAHYEKALSMGGLRREAETRLHAGIAMSKAGQKAEAIKMWDSAQGDPTATDIAQLWKFWQQAPEAAK